MTAKISIKKFQDLIKDKYIDFNMKHGLFWQDCDYVIICDTDKLNLDKFPKEKEEYNNNENNFVKLIYSARFMLFHLK